MNRVIEKFQEAQVRKDFPALRPGDTVRVHVRLKEGEGEKERIQPFEGVIIKKRGKSTGASFTVRRVSFGVGIERIFPANSPSISSIEVLRQGRVRRAKLYYLRGLKGKAARSAARRASGSARTCGDGERILGISKRAFILCEARGKFSRAFCFLRTAPALFRKICRNTQSIKSLACRCPACRPVANGGFNSRATDSRRGRVACEKDRLIRGSS